MSESEQRTIEQLAAAKNQRDALNANIEQGYADLARLADIIDDMIVAEREASPDSRPLIAVRLNALRRELSEKVTALEAEIERRDGYADRINSLLTNLESGEIMDKEELGR